MLRSTFQLVSGLGPARERRKRSTLSVGGTRIGWPALKQIEDEIGHLNLARPPHLRGIDGWAACSCSGVCRAGDRLALRLFAEYNLYDVINLRTLMAYAYNAQAAAEIERAPGSRGHVSSVPVPVPGRGDVL
jgi:hypothetical protein